MIRKITGIIAVLCNLIVAQAQDRLTLDLTAGISRNMLSGNQLENLSNGGVVKNGYNVIIGLSVFNPITTSFGLKHEVFYSPTTVGLHLNDGNQPVYKSKLNRQIIQLYPLSPAFHYKNLQISAGPYWGIVAGGAIQRKDQQGNLFKDHTIYGSSASSGGYLHKWDLGISGALAYTLSSKLHIGLRYTQGFIALTENTAEQQQQQVYSNYTTLAVGYRLF
ncbi:Uncharacterised protein [Sphingobacterium spiritivorum]|uniref:Outer membrane protein beta-barrel domain-containing protein n=1 Tax=Sphingobacterium spiritivorum TaxID=258 RepID=A0A380CWQ0_SPHSI|nr:hypothetical protein [Sphingobacterium spiritivorum]SUJ31007.1 Uncharacterised protein [Sphingobacterium spiritivorum]